MGSISTFTYSILAGIAPLISASIPFFAFRDKNINPKYFHHLLCISAGLLFAVATLELVPEAIELVLNSDYGSNVSDDHDHQPNNNNNTLIEDVKVKIRLPMIGIAFGFLVLIIIESFMRENGGSHSHSHLPSSSSSKNSNKNSTNHSTKGSNQSLKKRERIINNNEDIHHEKLQKDSELKINHENLESKEPLLTTATTTTATSSSSISPLSSGSSGSSDLDILQDEGDHHIDNTSNNNSKLSLTTFIALATHSFVDGIVISSAFKSSMHVGARVALAIVLHKIPDGLVLSSIVLSQQKNLNSNNSSGGGGGSKSQLYNPFYLFLIISMMTPLGSFLTTVIMSGITNETISFVLGFGSGTFLYITSTAILPEILSTSEKKSLSIFSIFIGYLIFLVIDGLLHSSH